MMIILWKWWSCSENYCYDSNPSSGVLLALMEGYKYKYTATEVGHRKLEPPPPYLPPLPLPGLRWNYCKLYSLAGKVYFNPKVLQNSKIGSQICRLPFLWTGASGQEETPPLWQVGKQTFLLFVCYLFTMRGSRLWFLSTHGGERQFFLLFASQLQKSSLERAAASKFWKICPVPSLSIILPTITEWVTTDVEIECYLVSFSALFQSFLTWFRWENYTYLIEKHTL